MTKPSKSANQNKMLLCSLRKSTNNTGYIYHTDSQYQTLFIYKHFFVTLNYDDQNETLKVTKLIGEVEGLRGILKTYEKDFSGLKEKILTISHNLNKDDITNEFKSYIKEIIDIGQNKKRNKNTFYKKLVEKFKKRKNTIKDYKDTISEVYSTWLQRVTELEKIDNIEKELNISSYEYTFPLARAIKREIVIHIGPTNSGKTYNAIKEMTEAKSGIYLAPLRLMANECYENLKDKGIKCSLITGEERIIDESSCHISSTVEMCQFSSRIDVAVIDEIQMISDQYRGWAWSQALVGVSANKVILVGSEECLPYVIPVINSLGEKYTIIKHERKTPLETRDPINKYSELKEGDAVVVFSRKQALETKHILELSGQSCSIIYGSLSPEVRRNEAKKFREGQTKILVATDAIGMV